LDENLTGYPLGIYQDPDGVELASLSDHAFAHLRWRILNGEFTSGDKVKESSLAKELGISRATIRETTRRLSGAGLLQIDAQRGVFVRTYSIEQILDIIDIRSALCDLTATLFLERATSADRRRIEELSRQVSDTTPQTYRDEDYITGLLFNEAVVRGAHNERLFALYHEAWQQIRVFKLHLLKSAPGIFDVHAYNRKVFWQGREHRAQLSEAITAGNRDDINLAMRRAAESSGARAREMFDEFAKATATSWRDRIASAKAGS